MHTFMTAAAPFAAAQHGRAVARLRGAARLAEGQAKVLGRRRDYLRIDVDRVHVARSLRGAEHAGDAAAAEAEKQHAR